MTTQIGKVAGLWRYPVQSLQGEKLQTLEFVEAGVVGDRGYCVVDDTNEGGTAGRAPWRRIIAWRARYLAEPKAGEDAPKVEITFDDGTVLNSDDPRLDGAISERLGRRGRLARHGAPDVKAPYKVSPCHLLTSATLKQLSDLYPQGRFAPERFRPNLLVDCGDRIGFIEQDWMQRSITIGAAEMVATEHCIRCALSTRPQGDLPKDAGILHTAQQFNEERVGIYAEISVPARVRIGDDAALL